MSGKPSWIRSFRALVTHFSQMSGRTAPTKTATLLQFTQTVRPSLVTFSFWLLLNVSGEAQISPIICDRSLPVISNDIGLKLENAGVSQLGRAARVVAQHDGTPAGGFVPTSWWLPRDMITDTHTISLSKLPAGRYWMLVGMYNAADGQRMEVLNPATGLSHASVPKGGAEDAQRAIAPGQQREWLDDGNYSLVSFFLPPTAGGGSRDAIPQNARGDHWWPAENV